MKLCLGFESTPYASYQPTRGRMRHAYGAGKNSGQVAKDLEKKYGIVQTFVEMEMDFITDLVEGAMQEDLDRILTMQRPSGKAVADRDTDKIQARFKRDIAMRKFDGMIPGVPTLASLRGVSHLRVHPYAARGSRPSFRDTGNYVNSFRAWTEN